MIKEIELNDKFGLYKNKEPYILAENETLNLKFVCDTNNKIVVHLQNGDRNATMIIKDKQVEVPEKLVFKGVLKGYVKVYSNGQEVERFTLEDLLITELADEKYIIPQIEALKVDEEAFKSDLTAKYKELKAQNDLLTKLVYAMCDIEAKGEQK